MEADKAVTEQVIKILEEKYKKEIEVIQKILTIPSLKDFLEKMNEEYKKDHKGADEKELPEKDSKTKYDKPWLVNAKPKKSHDEAEEQKIASPPTVEERKIKTSYGTRKETKKDAKKGKESKEETKKNVRKEIKKEFRKEVKKVEAKKTEGKKESKKTDTKKEAKKTEVKKEAKKEIKKEGKKAVKRVQKNVKKVKEEAKKEEQHKEIPSEVIAKIPEEKKTTEVVAKKEDVTTNVLELKPTVPPPEDLNKNAIPAKAEESKAQPILTSVVIKEEPITQEIKKEPEPKIEVIVKDIKEEKKSETIPDAKDVIKAETSSVSPPQQSQQAIAATEKPVVDPSNPQAKSS